jgi:hypothetical protein
MFLKKQYIRVKEEPRFKIIRQSKIVKQKKKDSDDDDGLPSISSGSSSDGDEAVRSELTRLKIQMNQIEKLLNKRKKKLDK